MSNQTFRRLLWLAVVSTLGAIISGGIVSATDASAACAAWPVCTDAFLSNPTNGLIWLDLGHRLLVLIAAIMAMVVGVASLRRRDTDPWLRWPLLSVPALLLIEAAAGAIIVVRQLYDLSDVWHLALALVALACQVVPAVAIGLPVVETPARTGGRAARDSRRLVQLAWWSAGAAGLVVLALSARMLPTTSGLQVAAGLPTNTGGALAMASMLAGSTLWQSWRSRRSDRLIMAVSAACLALVGGSALTLLLPAAQAGFGLGLGAVLWSTALALPILAMRRPLVAGPAPQAAVPPRERGRLGALVADYVSLTKPKVISLLLVTTLAAMYITEAGQPSLMLVIWTMLGGYLASGGAGAINCAFDSDIDINMGRTSRRPVPSGRISPRNAMIFGLVLSALSVVVMWVFTTPLATFFSTLGIVYYALFYTRWLKRSTWQNIIIGGGAGSLPPLVGWTAVTGSLNVAAVLLFVIVFYWTPPHFWALALVKQKDYARAGVPMLPVVAGEAETRWQILVYSVMLVALSLLMGLIGAMGWIYTLSAALLGGLFLHSAWAVWRVGDQKAIWGLYKYSLLYLALLFAVMVVDRLVL